jgi:hypothetical protein
MKKLITALLCITPLMFLNLGRAQQLSGQCVQSISDDGSTTNVVNTSGAGSSVCTLPNWPWQTCSGNCQGLCPVAGKVCTTCVSYYGGAVERKFSCTPGNDETTGTPVQAPCNGHLSCGCSSNWTAVPGGAPGTINCGAVGDPC